MGGGECCVQRYLLYYTGFLLLLVVSAAVVRLFLDTLRGSCAKRRGYGSSCCSRNRVITDEFVTAGKVTSSDVDGCLLLFGTKKRIK